MEITAQNHPLELFETWMNVAKATPGIKEPIAMFLATQSPDHELHGRVMLCKGWSEEGFLFFSNYQSRKGHELETNANAAAVFFWDPLFRQVQISGTVVRSSREISEKYWATRPRESQLSQFMSKQSQPAPERSTLDEEWKRTEAKFEGKPVPCPPHWGGYLLKPKTVEFWIGRPGRFHDRHEFTKTLDQWTYRRLYP